MTNFISKLRRNSPPQSEKSSASHKTLSWIIHNQLAVGPIPSSEERATFLIKSGFRSVLTLCSEPEGTPSEVLLAKVAWNRFPLPDSHSTQSMVPSDLVEVVKMVHQYIQTSPPLYVHCVAGMERSPSICVAYLHKYKGMPLWEALNCVKQANPRTNILDSQLKAIQKLVVR